MELCITVSSVPANVPAVERWLMARLDIKETGQMINEMAMEQWFMLDKMVMYVSPHIQAAFKAMKDVGKVLCDMQMGALMTVRGHVICGMGVEP